MGENVRMFNKTQSPVSVFIEQVNDARALSSHWKHKYNLAQAEADAARRLLSRDGRPLDHFPKFKAVCEQYAKARAENGGF